MQIHKTLANYSNEIYAANTLDAAIQTISDVAVNLGFVGAACVYSSRSRDRDNGFNLPCISLFGKQLRPACNDWPNMYNDELFKFDAVYKACLITTLPVVWSYDNRPRLVVEATRTATAGQVCAFGQMVKQTGLRGGISVPIHGLGGGFGYIAFSSNENLSYLLKQHNAYADHLLGITHRFYNAMAGELESAVVNNVKLTKRELECLSLMAMGKTTDVTAEILGLSYSTVRFHLHNAERKLGTYSRMHAIAKASYLGLLGPIE